MKKKLMVLIGLLSLVGLVSCDSGRQQQQDDTFQTDEYRPGEQEQMQEDLMEDEYNPTQDDTQFQEDTTTTPTDQDM